MSVSYSFCKTNLFSWEILGTYFLGKFKWNVGYSASEKIYKRSNTNSPTDWQRYSSSIPLKTDSQVRNMIARGYQQKQTEKNEPVLLNFD